MRPPRGAGARLTALTSILLGWFPSASAEFVPYDSNPVPISRVRPIYPDRALQLGTSGEIVLMVLVGKDGRVTSTRVVRGVEGLNEAAIDCVKQWIFKPAMIEDRPFRLWAVVAIPYPMSPCPQRILDGARAILSARVGSDYIARNLVLDSAQCDCSPLPRRHWRPAASIPYWTVAYTLRIPAKPWAIGTIFVNVDTLGSAIGEGAVVGIGDCARHPEDCSFRVDEEQARELALRAGLEPGLRPWHVEFGWVESPSPRYAWSLKNTLDVRGEREGRLARIDANTGEVLSIESWHDPRDYYDPAAPSPDSAVGRKQ